MGAPVAAPRRPAHKAPRLRIPRGAGAAALALSLAASQALGSAAIIREAGAVAILDPGAIPARKPVFREDELREFLSKFIGSPCRPEAIGEALAARYRFLGYVPSVDIACDSGTITAVVRESNQTIDLITFDPADLSRLGIAPDPAFRESRGLYPVPREAPRAVLLGLLQTRPGDLYNFERYRDENEALRRLGYAIAVIPGTPRELGGIRRAAYLLMSLRPDTRGARTRRKANYFGGTGTYEPRQGSSIGLLYQRDSLLTALDRLSVAPSYNASAGGELSYRAPLLARKEAPRRLYDLDLGLFSNYRHDRLLQGVETDERRSGAAATIGMRPLGLEAPHTFRLSLGIRHERTDLQEAIPPPGESRLTFLRLGAEYDWRHMERWPSVSIRIAPALDFAFTALGGERTFVRAGFDGRLHQRFSGAVEADFHLLGGFIDRAVPATELWSLGGAASLRGFREDSFLGRHFAALQSELWLPLFRNAPPAAGSAEELPEEPFRPRRIAHLLKGALFADTGEVSGSDAGVERAAGAGVGLRFLVPRQPLVIRLDYGAGFGAPGGDRLFYLSLALHR
ncbi:MAG TPA: BamA/TamA family outer membrane protein [Candidatus Polarisedimenticolia bacterium]|nr:BamA/TamA family outer membrane protein [Candidatus Polarisedimenticolia bacterium]